jgi:hypothetical protein
MALSVRERLKALAGPILITLPSEYIAFVERLEGRGSYCQHAGREWWALSIRGLEAPVRTDLMGLTMPTTPYAHYFVALIAALHAELPDDTIACCDGSHFPLERLQKGFCIGENDGDTVFLDQQSLGVFAYIHNDYCVEQWAGSFRDFLTAAECLQSPVKPSGRWQGPEDH